jgi:DNA-binding NarL/FixJ family response regulator
MPLATELTDVRVLALAGATAVANLLLQVPAPAAVLAGVAVPVAFALFRRAYPSQLEAAPPSIPYGGLSSREMEVARLVAEGMTNAQIAYRLPKLRGSGHITEHTVDRNIENINTKLGFHSRAQIAAWVVEKNLKTRDPDPEKKEPGA